MSLQLQVGMNRRHQATSLPRLAAMNHRHLATSPRHLVDTNHQVAVMNRHRMNLQP
jgi:hypothetical protein